MERNIDERREKYFEARISYILMQRRIETGRRFWKRESHILTLVLGVVEKLSIFLSQVVFHFGLFKFTELNILFVKKQKYHGDFEDSRCIADHHRSCGRR